MKNKILIAIIATLIGFVLVPRLLLIGLENWREFDCSIRSGDWSNWSHACVYEPSIEPESTGMGVKVRSGGVLCLGTSTCTSSVDFLK